MNDPRTRHGNREADVWGHLEAALARIPRERWSESGVLPGWSVQELLWHVAGWLEECAGHLEKIREGTFEDSEELEEETDTRNAAFAEVARGMDGDAVWSGLVAARNRVLQRWEELPEVDDTAIEWFAGETYQHYREHLPHLERFAG